MTSWYFLLLQVPADVHNNAKTLLLLQKKSDVYSVEIHGTKDLEKPETGDDKEKYKDLKGKKTSKKDDLKKELDLVSVAKLPLLLAGSLYPQSEQSPVKGSKTPVC